MKYKLTFALVASLTSTAFAAFQAPLPEFKNEKQLAEWRAEKASAATNQGYPAKETAFFTGKPYLASSGGYAFKYRSYSPELARWTSEDPSGFPDGANGSAYAPIPTGEFDWAGLVKVSFQTNNFSVTTSTVISCYATGEFEYELDTNGGYTFTKNTGAYTSAILSVHTDTPKKVSVGLGNFTLADSGTESNSTGGTRQWVKIAANFNITSDIAGAISTTPDVAHTSDKIFANWKE